MGRRSEDGGFLIITLLGLIFYTITEGNWWPLLIISGIFLLLHLFLSDKKVKQITTPKVEVQNLRLEPKKPYILTNNNLYGKLSEITDDIKGVNTLEKINVSTDKNIEISCLINNNPNLKEIKLSGPFYFSKEVNNAINLQVIHINNNEATSFLDKINFSINQSLSIDSISGFADDCLIRFQEITSLYVSNIPLTQPDFSNFKNLKSLQLKNTHITHFPYSIFNLPNLEYLALENNKISAILKKKIAINSYSKLRTVNLSGNILRNIPDEIFNIPSIKKIYVYDNHFSKFRLKSLKKSFADKIGFDYNQEQIIKRILSPETWKIIRLGITIFIGLAPYLFFDSLVCSCLLVFYILFLGGLNFLFTKD